jgi:outer membrane lipoprotein-sorting protein
MKQVMLLSMFLSAVVWPMTADDAAEKILKQAETIIYPDSFHVKNTLTTTGPGKNPAPIVFDVFHKKDTGTVMNILKPARSRGIRFLEKENGLWMYNPKARSGNAIRLSPRSSFQGSVFSNNDVSDSRYSDDYATVIKGEETLDAPELGQVPCLVLDGTAKHERAAYARIVMWVRKTDYLPLRMDYYARSGLLFKQMTLSVFKHTAGRLRPTKITMKSFELEDTVSTVLFEDMAIRNDLPDSMFTQASLTR